MFVLVGSFIWFCGEIFLDLNLLIICGWDFWVILIFLFLKLGFLFIFLFWFFRREVGFIFLILILMFLKKI